MFSVWTIISWLISLFVGRAILQLVILSIASLISLYVITLILRTLVQAFGIKIALYIAAGVFGVGLLGGLIYSWWPTPAPINPTIYAYVSDVTDGNTFVTPRGIFGRRTRPVTLQYIGTPALDAAFGPDAKDYLYLLVYDKSVAVQNPQTYNNQISGIVETPEGWIVQSVMVRAGMAWDTNGNWAREERAARKEKRGLWQVYSLAEIEEMRCTSIDIIQSTN